MSKWTENPHPGDTARNCSSGIPVFFHDPYTDCPLQVNSVRILIISHPFPWVTGGFKRSYEVLRRLSGPGLDITLLLSPAMAYDLVETVTREQQDPERVFASLREVQAAGIALHPASLRLIDDLFTQFRNPSRHHGLSWRSVIGPLIPANIGMARLLARFENQYLQDPGKYDIVYSHHECLDTVMLAQRLAKRLGIPFVILLHNQPFHPVRRILQIHPVASLADIPVLVPELNLNLSRQFVYQRILKSPQFTKFLAISPAPLEISGLSGAPHMILSPANALDDTLIPVPSGLVTKKGDYVIFASRFSEEKGILELPKIWKEIHERYPELRLLVYGNHSPGILKKFLDQVDNLSLGGTVAIRGYEHDQTLFYTMVRGARMLLHPSHSDGFSMIILECLALGTLVVAYDLPAFTYYYRDFAAVSLVPEWDRGAFCRSAVRILDRPDEYAASLIAEDLRAFIHRHCSWDNVAAHERQALLSLREDAGNGRDEK
jgi:glycosyltransferase involved in cell wall biosynthesis